MSTKGWNRQEIYRRAEDFRAKRKYRKAIKEYLSILEIDSKDHQVQNRLADIYQLIGESAQAIQYYERVAKHFYAEDRLDKVIPIVKQLLQLDPKNLQRYTDLAILLVKKEWVADAVDTYKQALRLVKGGRFVQERLKILEAILKLKTNDYQIRLELAKMYIKESQAAHAEELLLDGLEMMQRSKERWRRAYRWQLFKLHPGWNSFWAVWRD